MDLPSSQEPIKSLTPFPGKQGCLFTWSRPPVRQKFLFSAKRGHSCQLGHQSLRRVRGRGRPPPAQSLTACGARPPGSLSSVSCYGIPGGTGRSRSQARKQVGGEVGSTLGPKLPLLLSPLSWHRPGIHCLLSVPLSCRQLQGQVPEPSRPISLWPLPPLCSELTITGHFSGRALMFTVVSLKRLLLLSLSF